MQQIEKKTLRMFEIEQQQRFLTTEKLDKIKSWLLSLSSTLCLCVLHDKDTGVEPHYHIFVKMNGARSLDDIARQCDIELQQINFIDKWKNALAYAFHRTDTSKTKYQYDDSAIIFQQGIDYNNIIESDEEIKAKQQHSKFIKELLYKYGECEISFATLRNNMTAKDFDEFSQLYQKMKTFRQLKVRSRNMQVIYITGDSGSGKTTLAKYLAMASGFDCFISGSGKDILDGYDKEECIVLDDLRGDAFTQAELFKLTDNYTNSSVKSRYQNKDISNCKLMIITSIKQPKRLYDWQNGEEPTKQFARRLEYRFLKIDHSDIYEVPIDNDLNIDKTKQILKSPMLNMEQVNIAMGIAENNDRFANLMKRVGSYTREKIQESIKETNQNETNNQSIS